MRQRFPIALAFGVGGACALQLMKSADKTKKKKTKNNGITISIDSVKTKCFEASDAPLTHHTQPFHDFKSK